MDERGARSPAKARLVSRCGPFQKKFKNLFYFKNLKIYFFPGARGCCAATLRVAGAPEDCRFAAAGPNNAMLGKARQRQASLIRLLIAYWPARSLLNFNAHYTFLGAGSVFRRKTRRTPILVAKRRTCFDDLYNSFSSNTHNL